LDRRRREKLAWRENGGIGERVGAARGWALVLRNCLLAFTMRPVYRPGHWVMDERLLVSLAGMIVLGISAQWVAWRLRLPSILMLLLFGFLAGPILGWLDPDKLLGDWLMPLVSLSVGLILFEGGLTLKLHELKTIAGVVRNLITVGALVTWALAAVAAYGLFGWGWELSILTGAVLVVTGPTVVMPLLRHVQPARRVGSTLKWEGILIDPIGALLALLVFEAIIAKEAASVPLLAAVGFGKTLLVGGVLGIGAARLLVLAFERFWVPDHLQNPVALMLVVAMFTLSNQLQHEAGLLTVTIMGIALANQRSVHIRHIVEFKENLRTLLIAYLFILLSARLSVEQVRQLSPAAGLGFLAALVFVVRPLSVLVSSLRSELPVKERVFLSWLAPRGIVAAAVASLFALRLAAEGHPRALELVPVTFLVIVGTVALYGLTTAPLAKWLKLSTPNPQGVLLVGAHPLARAMGKALMAEEVPVLLADTNWENLAAARLAGLPTYYGNVLSEHARDELELSGIGRLVALTSNHEVNTLAAMGFVEFFGRSEVYQVQVEAAAPGKRTELAPHGRLLFGKDVHLDQLLARLVDGASVRKTTLTEEFTFDAWRNRQGARALPLFVVDGGGGLRLFTANNPPTPSKDQTLIALVDPKPGENGAEAVSVGEGESRESRESC